MITKNDKKYQANLIARGYTKLSALTKQQNTFINNNQENELLKSLAIEGEKLLEQENTTKSPTPEQNKELENTLGLVSKNPYIRARSQILKDLPPGRKKEIEEMERTGNTNNKDYQEFIKKISLLGDKFSA